MSRFPILVKFSKFRGDLSAIKHYAIGPKTFRLFWAQLEMNFARRFGKQKK